MFEAKKEKVVDRYRVEGGCDRQSFSRHKKVCRPKLLSGIGVSLYKESTILYKMKKKSSSVIGILPSQLWEAPSPA